VANSPTTCGVTHGCAISCAHNDQLHSHLCPDRVIGDFASLSAVNSPTVLRPTRGWDLVDVCDRSGATIRIAAAARIELPEQIHTHGQVLTSAGAKTLLALRVVSETAVNVSETRTRT
jgi:hypothetical protein